MNTKPPVCVKLIATAIARIKYTSVCIGSHAAVFIQYVVLAKYLLFTAINNHHSAGYGNNTGALVLPGILLRWTQAWKRTLQNTHH